ncbi:patatin family protein [Lachnospiraceae bacterium]|uniref:patatin-like phospholipase family protein n=1 Tax=Extibacter sp. GGCC_0201 TaxID=2731209 RepID=UPI001AA133D9|nr:patatin family protein [Extibacter sp. GGCC_0201]MBO1722435.1 patatin family protein [Extibacter sp. GGCC_0201]BDF33698.1 patatin family protein [Lachnospiraceae bacterium]BDF37702.1 patatin family protein [Lachnospiraceae bacterium]
MKKATIVLEGGATRGVFTSGALDYLMEMDVYLSHVIGVSAGACNGVDYVSRQPGRTRDCMIHKEKEYDYYYGFSKFIKEKSLLDMDMVFDKYPNEIFPFDFDTYFASDMECEIVTTNCVTGQAEYMKEDKDRERLMKLCRASSSMPLVSPIVNIDGIPYLDGGLADSIPVRRASELGNEKIVLMLTRNPGYRKKMTSKALANVYRRAYRKYPNLVRTTIRRNFEYNKTMRLVEQMEEEGRIFVFRPLIPTVSRLEKNYDTLMEFYQHGYHLMKKEFGNLMEYLDR